MPSIALSGSQLAILIFAATFLGAAAGHALAERLELPRDAAFDLSQLLSFSLCAAALVAIPSLRGRSRALLAARVAPRRYVEVAAVIVVFALGQFALFGYYAVSNWFAGGDEAVRGMSLGPSQAADRAFAASTLRHLAITCLIAPLIEEIAYRGFLFEAWTRTRSIAAAMILSSVVFALVHPTWAHALFAGLLLCSVYVRTGALRASILVHFSANALNWNPLLGQFVIPADNRGIQSWWFQLCCLVVVPACIVSYAWLASRSRDSRAEHTAAISAPP